ncbi:MAG: D-amino acid aminotransferase [Desulfobacteraceae bacterium]|nr:D-amino acid aminotransferase [Desulfobacteraceae bacterium]MBC2749823.1 D-amino acid aminotransferase [Desulfobacteraceae bacterium]
MPELAYLNGTIMPIENAAVPVEDRGYNFGDAVYEYVASYNGRLFYLEPHLDRLEHSMAALAFPPLPREKIRTAIETLFAEAAIDRAGIYIQISRGVAPRDHAFPADAELQFLMILRRVHEKPAVLRDKGAAAITVTDIRWGRCDIKTVQLLPNVLAKQQALEAGAYDAIFVAETGEVREGTSSNLFIIKDQSLITHPLTQRILPGITRMIILDICKAAGLSVEEAYFDKAALYAADEVFMSGTITEVLPITRIDDKPIGDGAVGPVTRRLNRDLLDRIGG